MSDKPRARKREVEIRRRLSLILSVSNKGAAKFNVSNQRTNRTDAFTTNARWGIWNLKTGLVVMRFKVYCFELTLWDETLVLSQVRRNCGQCMG